MRLIVTIRDMEVFFMGKDLQTLKGQNKLALWAGRISECRNSGQNVKAWCRENGVCEQAYYKWQRRIFEMAQAQQEVQFAEVTPVQSACYGNVAVTVVAVLTGIGVVDILPNNRLGRDDFQSSDNLLANLAHGIAVLRAYQIAYAVRRNHLDRRN